MTNCSYFINTQNNKHKVYLLVSEACIHTIRSSYVSNKVRNIPANGYKYLFHIRTVKIQIVDK